MGCAHTGFKLTTVSSSDARPVGKNHVNLFDTMKKRGTGERGTGL